MPRVGGQGQRVRLHMLSLLFGGIGLVLGLRLANIQYFEHETWSEMARERRLQTRELPARRGALLDSNGHPLALTLDYDSVHLVGADIRNPLDTAERLAPLVELAPEQVLARIDPGSKILLPLKSGLPNSSATAIAGLNLDGVVLKQEPVRLNPEGSIAAQVLGFVGREGKGLAGVEYSFQQELAGEPGQVQSERDSIGQEIALDERVLVEPKPGAALVLTLDRVVQRLAERTLAEAVVTSKGVGGLILIMEPTTGGILAMASQPTYNLTGDSLYQPGTEALYKTVQVTNQYEPGSVMKVVTMAAGLEEGVVAPGSVVNDTGQVQIGEAVLRNWDHRANGAITMTQVLIFSSNVGAQYVSGKLGADRFYGYIDAFGFGKPTGVRLPGETPGTVRTPADPDWARVDLATNAYGQGIAVTPVQMLAAVSAIANGGVLMRPRIVREIRRGEKIESVQPEPVRQAISPATAKTLTGMMADVLEQPALAAHRLPGYRFAGKTGTADLPTNLGYTTGKTYASIVAFGPLPTPRFSILVRIDAPEALYGGLVAAPVLKKIAQELVAYYRLPASVPPGQIAPAR